MCGASDHAPVRFQHRLDSFLAKTKNNVLPDRLMAIILSCHWAYFNLPTFKTLEVSSGFHRTLWSLLMSPEIFFPLTGKKSITFRQSTAFANRHKAEILRDKGINI